MPIQRLQPPSLLSFSARQIARRLRKRAEDVVYSEWTGAQLLGVDTDSYDIWKENGWWILPWEEILEVAQQQH